MSTQLGTAVLRAVSLFRDLPDPELELLADSFLRRRYGRNELIFSQGDAGDGLYIIVEGQVSIGREGPAGNELIITMLEPGEYFGELALFDGEPRSASAIAATDASLLFLPRTAFRAFLEAHPGAVLTCLSVVVQQLRHCTDLVDELALLDIRSRVATRLLRLQEQAGSGNGRYEQETFNITQQQLANMTGATRESINKHLNALVDEGIIRVERGHITILDRVRLEEFSEGMF
jgi:CRP/FNR family transcriptional regulator